MTDNLELQMDAYLPLRDVVFQTLRGAILKGDLKPGERLMELQLASKLGVSRTPIREAIRMLEQEGLAVTIPRKGAEVAKMTEKDMEDVLEIRLSLEGLAVRLSCEKITPAALQELKVAMEDFEAKTRSGQFVEMAKADVKFHEILYKASNNPKLQRLSQSRRLPLLQVVSNNKSFSVGVQSPTEINAPRGCAVILRRICQLTLTRITHQVSRAFDLNG